MTPSSSSGWRTRASSDRLGRANGAPELVRLGGQPQYAPPPTFPGQSAEPPVFGMPWRGVEWSPLFVSFLVYIWVIVTYSIAVGDIAMVCALVSLLLVKQPLRFPPFIAIFGGFVLWGGAGYLSTQYPAVVWDALILLGKLWLIALVAVNALRTREQIRFFIFFFLAAFALYPLRGALFNYFGGHTVVGRALWNYIYGNPNDLAALTLMPLAMVAALNLREPKGWPKLAAWAGMLLLPFLILLTQSRGGFLALVAFGLLALSAQRRRLRGVVVVAVIAGVAAVAAPSTLWERLAGLRNVTDTEQLGQVDREGSARQRFEIWKVARTIAVENPIVGVGVGAYGEANAVYATRSDFDRIAGGQRDTHSTYLNVAAETGFVGLGLFVVTFLSVAIRAERTRRRARVLLPLSSQQLLYLELGLLAYFIAAVFGSFARLSLPYLFLVLLWALTSIVAEDVERAEGRTLHAA